MYKLFNRSKLFILAFFCVLSSMGAFSQISPVVEQYGFSVQMSASLPSVKSEQSFKYIVNFTIPPTTSFEYMTVMIDPNLYIDDVIGPNTGSYAGNVPTFNWTHTGGFVGLTFGALYSYIDGPIGGSFEINVHLPADKACGGQSLSATVQLFGSHGGINITTAPITTPVVVDNPWHLQKFPTSLVYLGGTCPYGTLSETVNFKVRIVKTHPTNIGAETLTSITLADLFPPGSLINTSSYVPSANMAGTSITPTGIINFPSGFFLDPNNHVPYDASFDLTFPPMAVGDCDNNAVQLTGVNPCGNTETLNATVGVQKLNNNPIGNLVKQVFPNGNLPGCTGIYRIKVSNTGGSNLIYTLNDPFPSDLSLVNLISSPSGTSVSHTLLNYTITSTSTGLVPGGVDVYDFSYQISTSTTSSTISNTVTAIAGFTGSYTANIYMLPTAATACLQKTICSYNPSGYSIGQHVRFRIRVQNIGGSQIVTPTIIDNIDLNNLQYVAGSETYYTTDNAAPLTTCILPGATWPFTVHPWTITGSSYSAGLLTYNLPNIPPGQCTSVRTPVCGSAYYLPAYYVEFDVVIINEAGIGNVRNIAEIAGSNITTTTASTTFLVNHPVNYTIRKEVSRDGIVYQPSVGVAAGTSVYYRLRELNYGASLIDPVIVDLLPRNNGSADEYILNHTTRSSNTDVRFNSFINSNIGSYNQFYDFTAGSKIYTTPELDITSGGLIPSWNATPFLGAPNFKTEFHTPFNVLPNLEYIFKATVSPSARQKDGACNTYALRGSIKYLQNYVPDVRHLIPLESNPACIEVKSDSCACTPYAFVVPDTVCLGFNAHFEVSDSCAGANTYTWNFGDGTAPVTGISVNHTYASAGIYGVTVTWHGPCGEGGREFQILIQDCRCDLKVSWIITRTGLHVFADGSSTTSSYPIFMYVWDFGDGTAPTPGITATHDYTTAGSYVVTLTVYTMDTKGNLCRCTGKCSAEILVNESDGQNRCTPRGGEIGNEGSIPLKLSNSITMTATPNPFRDKVTVNFKQENKETKIKSYTLEFISDAGITLQKKQLNSLDKAVDFNTSNYTAGIYFVLLKDNNGQMQNVKVIKLD
ncbi:MAG: PKD domain-containing protein [Ferruginibacter sp.]